MIIRQACPFEVKSLSEATADFGKIGVFSGYASTYGNIDRDSDVIDKGAFESASAKQTKLLWQHSVHEPIGVFKAFRDDDHGLFVEGELNLEVQRGREAYALMKQGALSDMSVGFRVAKGGSYEKEFQDGGTRRRVRHIKKAGLVEISIVTMPANPLANVTAVKSADGTLLTVRGFEKFLRDAGFSKRGSALIVSKGYAEFLKLAVDGRDADDADDDRILAELDDAKSSERDAVEKALKNVDTPDDAALAEMVNRIFAKA